MMTFLRSQSKTVLFVILAVLGIGLLFFGNTGSLPGGGNAPTDFGRINGEDLSVADLYAAVRDTRNSLMLQGREEGMPQAQIAMRAWADLLLLHEADKLHVDVSDQEMLAYIQARPEFQKNGVYSPELYQTAMNYLENARHISPDMYAGMIHNQLKISAVSRALFSSIRAPASDISTQFERYYGPVQISYVSFTPATFAKSVQVTPQDIEAAYKADPMNSGYRTDEKRKVDYVLFPLTPEQMKLPDKDKNTAIQALGEKALEFALALQPDPSATANSTPPAADFQAEAKKRGLTPVSTDFFTSTTPPSGMPPSPAFNNEAFALTKENPNSKVIQLDRGVVVMHLAQIEPSELKPLAEVTGVIEKQLQQQKAAQAEQLSAAIAAKTLRDAVAKGADFKTTATAQHLPVQTVSGIVPFKLLQDQQADALKRILAEASIRLTAGEVSEPLPLESAGNIIVAHLDSRVPGDHAELANFETRYGQFQDQQIRNMAELDWVNWKSKQPGTHPPPNLAAYGSIE